LTVDMTPLVWSTKPVDGDGQETTTLPVEYEMLSEGATAPIAKAVGSDKPLAKVVGVGERLPPALIYS
jgi:hypothetical protein